MYNYSVNMALTLIQLFGLVFFAGFFNVGSFIARITRTKRKVWEYKTPNFESIHRAVKFVLSVEGISTRQELDAWCRGKNREPLYNEVKKLAPSRWQVVNNPKKYVRNIYEVMLPGYTNARLH